MKRLDNIDPNTADGKTKEMFQAVNSSLGMVPNMMRTMANSPVVLDGYLSFSKALSSGMLSPQLRELIALAVAEANACGYCVAAHTAIGGSVGIGAETMLAAREQSVEDVRISAAIMFANQLLNGRGDIDEEAFRAIKDTGYSDGEIAEIVANVAINIFTNYFNKAVGTEIDFPNVDLLTRSASV